MTHLKDKRLFLLDMDGTIYLDQTLFPGTVPFLDAVRAKGGRYLFLTNNSSKSVDAYIEKLSGMGIPAVQDDFLTSVDAMIADLAAPGRSAGSWRRRAYPSQTGRRGMSTACSLALIRN